MSSKSVVNTLYSGSAAIGEVKATITLVVTLIITCSMMASAIYSITSVPERTADVQAEVTESVCTQIRRQLKDGKEEKSAQCMTDVRYTIADKVYTAKVSTNSSAFNQGEKINIKYNPKNPIDISYNEVPLSTVGWILSGVGFLLLCIVSIYYYLINRFKPLAALEGASTSIDLAKGFTRKIFN